MKKLAALLLTLQSAFVLTMPVLVYAAPGDVVCDQLNTQSQGTVKCDGSSESSVSKIIEQVVNLLTFIIGTAAVVIIVVAGLMYVVSGGNPQNTARAKDAIIYAVVGLIVTVMARLVVNFVISRIG